MMDEILWYVERDAVNLFIYLISIILLSQILNALFTLHKLITFRKS